jgi:hypothetical protein
MDFEFSEDEQRFLREVEDFLTANYDPDVMDPSRENLAQLVDTPARRNFMKKLAARGWLGITWPSEFGGQDGQGFYEYLLNEKLYWGCRQDPDQGRIGEIEARVSSWNTWRGYRICAWLHRAVSWLGCRGHAAESGT